MAAHEGNLVLGDDDTNYSYGGSHGSTWASTGLDTESGLPVGTDLTPFFCKLTDGRPGRIFLGVSENHLKSRAELLPPPKEHWINRAYDWIMNSIWRPFFNNVCPPEPTVLEMSGRPGYVIAACPAICIIDPDDVFSLRYSIGGNTTLLTAVGIANYPNGYEHRGANIFTWRNWKAKYGLDIEWDQLVDALNDGGVLIIAGGVPIVDPVNGVLATGNNSARKEIIDVQINGDLVSESDDLNTTSICTYPKHGIAELNSDGTITYIANKDYGGLDSFDCNVSDGKGGTKPATVSMLVVAEDEDRKRVAALKKAAKEAEDARIAAGLRNKGAVIVTNRERRVVRKYKSLYQAKTGEAAFVGMKVFPKCKSLGGGCNCKGKNCKRSILGKDITDALDGRFQCMVNQKGKDADIEELWIEYYSFEKFGEYEVINELHPNPDSSR